MAVVHLNEIGLIEGGLELLGQNWRIIGGDSERDGSTNVAEDGISDGIGHLGNILVGDG